MRERRTVFSRLDRIGNFDSRNRPFGFYYCRISLAGPLLVDFCNNIGQIRTHAVQQNDLFDHLVRAHQNRSGCGKAERLCGLEVDGHLELGRKLNG